MSKPVIRLAPDKPDRSGSIPLISDQNFSHVATLLAIANSLAIYLVVQKAVGGEGVEVDKEASLAASTTFIHCCNRLDAILQEQKRWDVTTLDALSDALKKCYIAQELAINEGRQLATMAVAPHVLLRPGLKKRADGTWEARYGVGKNGLTGTGNTAHEAIQQFNAAYYGAFGNEI